MGVSCPRGVSKTPGYPGRHQGAEISTRAKPESHPLTLQRGNPPAPGARGRAPHPEKAGYMETRPPPMTGRSPPPHTARQRSITIKTYRYIIRLCYQRRNPEHIHNLNSKDILILSIRGPLLVSPKLRASRGARCAVGTREPIDRCLGPVLDEMSGVAQVVAASRGAAIGISTVQGVCPCVPLQHSVREDQCFVQVQQKTSVC